MPALCKGQPGKEDLGVSIRQAFFACSPNTLTAGKLKVKLLPSLVFRSLSWCSHALQFFSETQVLSQASQPEARPFSAILELHGVAPGGPACPL